MSYSIRYWDARGDHEDFLVARDAEAAYKEFRAEHCGERGLSVVSIRLVSAKWEE